MAPRRYWQCVLAASVAVSVAGNVGHAALTAPAALKVPACLAAALPPLALMVVTEGIARSAGAGVRRRVYRAAVTGAVGIAGLAFVLSFAALRDLAVLLGQPAAVAAGWPLLADLTIAVSAAMALALSAPTHRAGAPLSTDGHPAAVNGHPVATPAADAMTSGITVPPSHVETATELVRSGRVRADVTAVAAAVAGLAAGDSHRAVAAATGLHRTSVARVAAEVGAGG
jgi:Protein of unknown function (DUF2637)